MTADGVAAAKIIADAIRSLAAAVETLAYCTDPAKYSPPSSRDRRDR